MLKKTLTAALFGLSLGLTAIQPVQADEKKAQSAEDIIVRSLQSFDGDDAVGEAIYKTHLKREDRVEEVRMFRFWKAYRGVDGLHSKTLFFHTYPPQNNTAILVWSFMPETGKDPKRWLYMPMFKSVEEIHAEEAAKIPGGGDPFFYSSVLQVQQLVPRMPWLDTHTFEENEKADDDKYYVIKSIPKEANDDFRFGHTVTWIRKDNYLPIKTAYANQHGETVIVKNTAWERMDGEWVWKKVVATDLRTGNETTLTFNDSKVNVGLKDELFTKEALKKRPEDFL